MVLPTAIPDKGAVLTRLSLWWFDRLGDLVPNHVISGDDVPPEFAGRAMRCRRLEMLPVECVARGYLTGGGLKDYEKTGAVSGVTLPPGLVDGSQLPEPIFTPSTKAPLGQHDEAMTFAEVEDLVGAQTAARLRDLTLAVYARGAETAAANGILVADTKLEFGHDPATGEIVLADEVLTPDSSRFWPARALGARPRRSPRSTSSSCATGRRRSTGTAPRRARRCLRRSSPRPAPATSRPTSASPVTVGSDRPFGAQNVPDIPSDGIGRATITGSSPTRAIRLMEQSIVVATFE